MTINAPDSASSVRCPECETTVTDDGFDEPVPIVIAQSRKSRPKSNAVAVAAEEPLPDSAFEPAIPPMPTIKTRKVKRRKEPPPNTEKVEINPFPKWVLAWVDPATLLWLPLLGPSLAFTGGAVLFGVTFRALGILIMPGMLFGTFLGLMPAALTVYQWCEILREWSMGAERDPEWPTFDGYEMLRRLAQWVGSFAIAVGMGYGAYRGIVWLGEKQHWAQALPEWKISIVVAVVYFPVGLLAAILWDSLIAANPLVVGMAMFRLRKGAWSFWIEYAIHLAFHAGCLRVVLNFKLDSLALGMFAWVVWWCIVLLSVSRLMRALGRFYFRNKKNVGWFS